MRNARQTEAPLLRNPGQRDEAGEKKIIFRQLSSSLS
jgi:hypothetical protein